MTPANFTFAIWGVIYIWQTAWLVYAWTFVCRPEAVRTIATSVYPGFTASSIVNIVWLYLFGNELINWSEIFLIAFNVIIYITISSLVFYFYAHVPTASKMDVLLTKVLVLNGLSLYATWTTVASLLNTSIVLQYTFDIDPSTVGTVTLSLLTVVLVLYFILENTILAVYARDVFTVYPVVIWALIGILDKHWGKPGEEENALYTLILLIGTIALMLLRSGMMVVFHHFRRAGSGKQTLVKTVN